jgi:nucleotide-binding universal stress UspA family protein
MGFTAVMKTILVPVEEHSLVDSVLETALLLGRKFDAYIEGIAVTFDLPVVLPIDIAIGVPSPVAPETRHEMADTSRRHFESFMRTAGISASASAGVPGLSFGWRQNELMDDAFVGTYGRIFDICVVGRPDGTANHPRASTVEAALFEAGRPVLIAVPSVPATIGETIVIAWNKSTETARTVAAAMPLLKRARRVIVLELEDWGVEGPSGADLARLLRMHDMAVEARTVPDPNNRPGEAIISEATALGCDLLVKGAYTQSRLRQMFFGGATSHILARTTIPVLMAH